MNASTREKEQPERKVAEQFHRRDVQLHLPLLGAVTLPPPEHLAFYAGIGALAALEIVEWPVALLVAVGHALAADQHHRSLEAFGEALESA